MRALAFTLSFLLAFLLFAVQPMATRMVLPALGGTPAVWNTVMFTFQLLLLGGYAYAHLLSTQLRPRWQLVAHGGMIALSFLLLPLWVVFSTSATELVSAPIPHLLAALLTQIGLPFFCLAATAPLLQSWVSRSAHPLSKTPYVLYSASNLGSFTGLIGYVAVVEPLLGLPTQSEGWSLFYAIGMGVLLLTGWLLKPQAQREESKFQGTAPGWRERGMWMGLAFLPSSLSLGVTTYITTDIASIPLLWVVPLSLYLLSYVDAFRERPFLVKACQRYAPLLGLIALMLYVFNAHSFTQTFLFQLLAFGMLAVALHGWVAARKPAPAYLTQFYLCLSVGGALGGLLNGLVAPLLFRQAFEYPIVLLIACFVSFTLFHRREGHYGSLRPLVRFALQVAVSVILFTAFFYLLSSYDEPQLNSEKLINAAGYAGLVTLAIFRRYVQAFYTCIMVAIVGLVALSNGVVGKTTLFKDRNFFGVLRVYEDKALNARFIMHDTTLHGLQSLDPKQARTIYSYYGVMKDTLARLPVTRRHPIAVVGLGAGTLKCLGAKGQEVDLYEINPMSQYLAENPEYFTYLRDCPATSRVLLGDGRVRLNEQEQGRYSAIIMDAFSSDAIPSHLLTEEAIRMYMDKLAPGGVLIFHTTNRHINLWPLLAAQANDLGLHAYGTSQKPPAGTKLEYRSFWVILVRAPKDLGGLTHWEKLVDEGNRPWTDQYVNLLPYFKFLRSD